MTAAGLRETARHGAPPEELPVLVEAMWWAAHGDWERAHGMAQEIGSREGAWVHAYLHRAQGDVGNAGYWYSRAGRPMARGSEAEEWEQVTSALLGSDGGGRAG